MPSIGKRQKQSYRPKLTIVCEYGFYCCLYNYVKGFIDKLYTVVATPTGPNIYIDPMFLPCNNAYMLIFVIKKILLTKIVRLENITYIMYWRFRKTNR